MRLSEQQLRAIEDPIVNDAPSCEECEGDGLVYADGKAHSPNECAPIVECPNCEGKGTCLPYEQQLILSLTDGLRQAYRVTEALAAVLRLHCNSADGVLRTVYLPFRGTDREEE